jgi:hypothetical protein
MKIMILVERDNAQEDVKHQMDARPGIGFERGFETVINDRKVARFVERHFESYLVRAD